MGKSKLKNSHKVVTEIVDSETGEVLSTNIKIHKYIASSKDEFMLLYVNVLPIFIGLSNPAKTVYAYLLSNYNSNVTFEIASGTRSLISNTYGMSLSAVANALTELKEHSLIYSHTKGMYQINPRYAFKGSSNDRNSALKAIIELGCKDC
jgi:hypothetical protein